MKGWEWTVERRCWKEQMRLWQFGWSCQVLLHQTKPWWPWELHTWTPTVRLRLQAEPAHQSTNWETIHYSWERKEILVTRSKCSGILHCHKQTHYAENAVATLLGALTWQTSWQLLCRKKSIAAFFSIRNTVQTNALTKSCSLVFWMVLALSLLQWLEVVI